jgi:hypothetical protein
LATDLEPHQMRADHRYGRAGASHQISTSGNGGQPEIGGAVKRRIGKASPSRGQAQAVRHSWQCSFIVRPPPRGGLKEVRQCRTSCAGVFDNSNTRRTQSLKQHPEAGAYLREVTAASG